MRVFKQTYMVEKVVETICCFLSNLDLLSLVDMFQEKELLF